jgi:hypothetical protein
MKIGYIGGFWSTNIGNSFYNIGMLWMLKKIYGDKNVFFIPDPPQVNWPNLVGDYRLIESLDIDLYILSGPLLSVDIISMYSGIFESITKKGARIAFISAGAGNYTNTEAEIVSNFLNKYKINFVFTRDSQTFDLYKNKLNTLVFNGLCTSMFLNDAISPPKIISEYIVTNFPFFHEPLIKVEGDQWSIGRNSIFRRQETVAGLPVVRLQSKGALPNLKFLSSHNLVYTRKNMYYSDLPYGYLSIIKSAKVIFSDRVHTCAASLIMGSSCMYVKGQKRSKDGRSNIFFRLGLPDIYNKPVSLDFSYIESEKFEMMTALADVLPPNKIADPIL